MGDDAALWAFIHFYHLDKANAATHCASVRFSPLPFRLADTVAAGWSTGEDFIAELAEVLHDKGAYPEDGGR